MKFKDWILRLEEDWDWGHDFQQRRDPYGLRLGGEDLGRAALTGLARGVGGQMAKALQSAGHTTVGTLGQAGYLPYDPNHMKYDEQRSIVTFRMRADLPVDGGAVYQGKGSHGEPIIDKTRMKKAAISTLYKALADKHRMHQNEVDRYYVMSATRVVFNGGPYFVDNVPYIEIIAYLRKTGAGLLSTLRSGANRAEAEATPTTG